MNRHRYRRDAKRVALASIAWRHPWLVLLGPWVARGVGLLVSYEAMVWVYGVVPHHTLAWLTGGVCAGAAVAAVLYRRASAPQRGSRLPTLGRPVLAWAVASVGMLLLAGAAWSAVGGTP